MAEAEAILARHPDVSPEELAAAATVIAPELERFDREVASATSPRPARRARQSSAPSRLSASAFQWF
jgi:hypothetical protein